MKTFADRLAFAREQKGLNQTEMARRIHLRIGRCTPQAVQKWESVPPKETIPRQDALRAIVDELGHSVGWFMTGEGEVVQPLRTWEAGENDDILLIYLAAR